MSINDSNIFEIDQNNFKGSLDLLLDLFKVLNFSIELENIKPKGARHNKV